MPSVVVGEVSLLDRGERDLVLSGWSGADVGAPVGVAPQLLAAAVAADPDAVAVLDGAREVSYRELDEWSTRLARVLIEAGVGPERAVGVAMDRCAGVGGGVVGGGQGRRGVCAGGSGPSGRAHRHGVGRGGRGVCADLWRRHRGRGRGAPGAAHRRSGCVRAERGSDHRRRPAGAAGGGQHRLCDLHVGVHRCPQGGGGQPRRSAGGGRGATRDVRVGRGCAGADGGRADL